MAKRKRHIKHRHSTKGRLIKGMTYRMPATILKSPIFKEKLKEMMKNYAGIYGLYRDDKLYYLGLTRNLLGRINWHLKDRHKGKWNSFQIFRIKKVDYLKDIETLLLHIVKTKGNRVKGRVPKDAQLNWALREIYNDHKKEMKELEDSFSKT
jgi:predicted GIY-YIG superfamily endonuclease